MIDEFSFFNPPTGDPPPSCGMKDTDLFFFVLPSWNLSEARRFSWFESKSDPRRIRFSNWSLHSLSNQPQVEPGPSKWGRGFKICICFGFLGIFQTSRVGLYVSKPQYVGAQVKISSRPTHVWPFLRGQCLLPTRGQTHSSRRLFSGQTARGAGIECDLAASTNRRPVTADFTFTVSRRANFTRLY